jgi:hypothetical protein
VEKYYNDNPKRFTELTLSRIQVPLRTKDGSKPDEAALKKLADDLHQRAVSGADFKTLQNEAYEKAGLQNPPDPKLVLKEDRVQPAQQAILQLKPGEVSEVVQEPAGFSIYKLEGQRTIPLDDARQEIQNVLASEMFRKEMEDFTRRATPDLNAQYFGPAPPVGPPSGLGPRPMPQPGAATVPPAQGAKGPMVQPGPTAAPATQAPGPPPDAQATPK